MFMNILKRIENRTGKKPATLKRGGPGGGGEVELESWGETLLFLYSSLKKHIQHHFEEYVR